MKRIIIVITIFLFGCNPSIIKYGFLPGSDYEIYAPINKIDLQNYKIHYKISDKRDASNKVQCSNVLVDRDSELEGKLGLDVFSNYLITLTDSCLGKIDSLSNNIFNIELKTIGPNLPEYGGSTVYGFVQFNISSKFINKTYCSQIKDGDDGAPLGKFSFATRKTAMRLMVSAACRNAIEEFLIDISKL